MEKEQLITLVKQSQSGDTAAMEQLLKYAHTSVSYQCRKMLNNAQDAEDMTQEVLLAIYTKLDTLQVPAAFHKWVNQITASRCINALNRTHVEYQFAEDEEGHSILDNLEELDEQIIPDKAIDNAETARMIEEIVSSLPDAQRAATLMFYYNEMSVKEIALTMKVSENTVKSRLNYARKAIKDKVLDYEKQGVKLYGLSPLPFLLYFLRLAAQRSANREAAGTMVAGIMSGNTAAGITVNAGSAGAAAAAGGAAVAAGNTAATGIFAGFSIKLAAGVLAAVVTLGGVAALVIPGWLSGTVNPSLDSIRSTEESEESAKTEDPTAEVTDPVETDPQEDNTNSTETESEATEPTESESTTTPNESTGPADNADICISCGIGTMMIVDLNTDPCAYRGYVAYTCNHCGYVGGYGYPLLEGHKMVGGVCSVCGFTQAECEHFYDSGVEYWPAGQMTWEPYIEYTCQWCGHTYTELIDYLS